MQQFSIPFIEYPIPKCCQTGYWLDNFLDGMKPKVEKTAVKLCAVCDLVFVELKEELITKHREVIKGIFNKRKVKEEYCEKIIYSVICKGQSPQEDKFLLLKKGAVIGAKYLT
jgi:hypothetical protein